jgi:hypothetical protein
MAVPVLRLTFLAPAPHMQVAGVVVRTPPQEQVAQVVAAMEAPWVDRPVQQILVVGVAVVLVPQAVQAALV